MEELTEEVFINRARIFFYEVAGVESAALDADANLIESGILDSLGLLRIVVFAEERFGITMGDEDLLPENFASVDAICAYLRARAN